jgi:hypothetical protein
LSQISQLADVMLGPASSHSSILFQIGLGKMSRGKIESSFALCIIEFTEVVETFVNDDRARIGIRKRLIFKSL